MPIEAVKTFSLRSIQSWVAGSSSEASQEIEQLFNCYEKVWFISIVDYGHPKIMLAAEDTICFEFDDYDLQTIGDFYDPEWEKFELASGPMFTAPEARRMITFIERVHKDSRRGLLAVHCHAGVSRSGAVAKFVQETYKLNEDTFYKMNCNIEPNQFVLKLLKENLV